MRNHRRLQKPTRSARVSNFDADQLAKIGFGSSPSSRTAWPDRNFRRLRSAENRRPRSKSLSRGSANFRRACPKLSGSVSTHRSRSQRPGPCKNAASKSRRFDVVEGGNRHMHAIDGRITCRNGESRTDHRHARRPTDRARRPISALLHPRTAATRQRRSLQSLQQRLGHELHHVVRRRHALPLQSRYHASV